MDVVLISGRSLTAREHPSRVRARALAESLCARGDSVRWLCPVQDGEKTDAANFCEPIPSVAPGFRSVQGRLTDLATELRLARELRTSPPALVHLLAYGGGTSEALPWISERLGVPCVVSLEVRETLCHRGSLVDETGQICDAWDEPMRCQTCCTAPGEGGLSGLQAFAAKLLRPLGGLSPFPSRMDFENRADLLVAGLMAAAVVLVSDEQAREQLVRAGVPQRGVAIEGGGSVVDTLRLYDSMGSSAGC